MSVEPNAKDRLLATEITNALVFARRAVDYELPAFEMTSIITPILAAHRADDEGKTRCSGCGHPMSDHDKYGCWWGCALGACEKDSRAERGVANPMLDEPNRAAADDAGELAKALEAVVTALDDIPALTIHGSADLFQAYHAAKKLLHAAKGA